MLCTFIMYTHNIVWLSSYFLINIVCYILIKQMDKLKAVK